MGFLAMIGFGRRYTVRAILVSRWLLAAIFCASGLSVYLASAEALDKTGKADEWTLSNEEIGGMENSVLRYTNEERTKRALDPLQFSPALGFLAVQHARHMCETGSLKHESLAFPEGWQKFFQRLQIIGLSAGGENIAYRTVQATPDQWGKAVVDGWMRSPNHRKNILRGEFRFVGVGVVPCAKRIAYVSQVFSPYTGQYPAHDIGR
jgi:uncharacterized protein YkwD